MSTIDELYSLIRDGKLPYPPRLTKYELAKIIAVRTRQLMDGAPPLVNPKELSTSDPVAIATEELKRGLLPFIIIRRLPNNKSVEYSLRELQELENKVLSY
ncbi:MAG: DNA-directed RNA polymerase subunit K [Caldivirga sp.]|jgi:DNA-directed RNA polymerase, subunit K (EC 2.7.7.6)|uniref:DNA-directed RNA polymerase subunit K n=1 Tax=Caldivirga sp. MU80 TaxID=1650354 RepID=UPI00074758C3|nr:DNA-directed RNA polymerase subunit K [Caldivirga sp. MU80]KUO92706.1 MAG: DNA-directed RNA polymerase subunit K [Caldivirga sp. JCHS_4]